MFRNVVRLCNDPQNGVFTYCKNGIEYIVLSQKNDANLIPDVDSRCGYLNT